MTRRLLAAAILVLVLPQLAFARPAVIRIFEGVAHAAPARDAAVLHVFAERAEVSVSEEVEDGWRRVRLPDGGVGWIEESTLAFPEAAGANPAAAPVPAALLPAPAAAPSPDLRPRIYVKDLSHLSELVRSDATVAPKAEALAKRRRTSIGVLIVGGIAAAALVGASVAKETPDPGDPRFESTLDEKGRLLGAGVVTALAAGVLGVVIHPRRGELLDVLNAWNTAHPDRPFEIRSGEVGH